MKLEERVPAALAGAMGEYMYVACFNTQEELDAFCADIMNCQ